ncbi:alanyl-tRNA editing protein [Thermococcus waiotapuensis]|uniref:DHHA1 domain-containing protein n=1 Tax=Thermococcus waiotapuensis TaxID=90909 RepID=A0AAE4T491_9EURY|nr:DHHA1 domain-containing protein [Thermococcus waiotapuensis]MDV3104648.1 DHHA1 domain-containing protein [Thermococcus waiotapuensis]
MVEKLFYSDPYLKETTARVVEVKDLGNGRVALRLEGTIFYPEGGGQPSDRGFIEGDGFKIRVEHVREAGDVWHEGTLEGKLPEPGDSIRMLLDWEWRYENMRNHTGQHILSAVLKRLYGLETTGFQIFEGYNKIEVDGEIDWGMVERAEVEANEIVSRGLPVEVEEYRYLPEDIAAILRKHVTKVTDRVRIVKIGDVDVTPCGGTHVRSTSEVGLIKVLRFYQKSRNLWRIEFACGNRALKYLNGVLQDYWASLEEMPNKNRPLVERVRELKGEIERLEAEKGSLRKELWEWKGRALLKAAEDVGGVKVVAHLEGSPLKDAEAFAVYLVDKNPNTIALIIGENYAIFAKNREVRGISMNELLKQVLRETGGGGGGSEVLARGGGFKETPEKVLEAALRAVRESLSRASF